MVLNFDGAGNAEHMGVSLLVNCCRVMNHIVYIHVLGHEAPHINADRSRHGLESEVEIHISYGATMWKW
jgi:hypothetical protein